MHSISRNTSRHLLLFSLASAILSSNVLAEGAARVFECSLQQQCDARGICGTDTGEVMFRMEPQQLDNQGAGSYHLLYEDKDVTMQSVSDAGPFTWIEEGTRHTLLVNAGDTLLWHQLTFAPALEAKTILLNCSFSQ